MPPLQETLQLDRHMSQTPDNKIGKTIKSRLITNRGSQFTG